MDELKTELQQIKEFIKEQTILSKEVLTLAELSLYLGQSKSSIYKLTSKKEIPFYTPGGKKCYFRKSEIDNWIFNSKVIPVDQVDQEVESYLGRTNKIQGS
jgi:excisionase family DNA binding protein